MKEPLDYRSAGVDIEKGDRFARFIASFKSKAVSGSIGGFSGGIEFDPKAFDNPILLSTTDGVGTKLIVAQKFGKFDTIGIDLVAMNANDLAVCGAQPLSFLDYIAIGKIKDELLHDIVEGIVKGCEIADCTLVGGETAEMPDLYHGDDFDLAGFCVGIVDKGKMLPKLSEQREGDPIYGLASSGVHSNGLSLARKAVPESDRLAWKELLTPTLIYVRELMHLAGAGVISGAAHITGGGLEGNFVRVVAKGLAPSFTWDWKVPDVFRAIQEGGRIETEEMRKVFNLGIGIALAVPRAKEAEFHKACSSGGITAFRIGELVRG